MIVGYYIVGFIDILGQREHFKNSPQLLDNNKDEIISLLKRTFFKIESFKEIIETIISSFDNYDFKYFDKEKFNIPEVRYSRFSDCLEMHSCMSEITGKEVPLTSLYLILLACAGINILSLADGYSVRGGLTIGIACETAEVSIYGPALHSAVSLEEHNAVFPRIVVDKKIVDYINFKKNGKGENHKARLERELAIKCSELIISDSDNYFIHFLSSKVFDILSKNKNEIKNRVKSFVIDQINSESISTRVREKYQWIIEYDKNSDNTLNFT